MATIIKICKWVWEGLVRFFTWFVGLPALIVSAITGLYSSISSLISSLTQGSSLAGTWFDTLNGASIGMVQGVSNAPDIVKVVMYALSMDTLFTYITSVFAIFVVLLIAVLTFFCVSIPVFLINMYAVKLAAWFICALFPRGYCITGISALANMNLATPIREAMKDGKYNPWLGG